MTKGKGLAERSCKACRVGAAPLKDEALDELTEQLGGGWDVVGEHHLHKNFHFDDFAGALAFVNRVGALAEEQGHHPDVHLSWGKVGVTVFTHKVDGLSEADFVLAAKVDRLPT